MLTESTADAERWQSCYFCAHCVSSSLQATGSDHRWPISKLLLGPCVGIAAGRGHCAARRDPHIVSELTPQIGIRMWWQCDPKSPRYNVNNAFLSLACVSSTPCSRVVVQICWRIRLLFAVTAYNDMHSTVHRDTRRISANAQPGRKQTPTSDIQPVTQQCVRSNTTHP